MEDFRLVALSLGLPRYSPSGKETTYQCSSVPGLGRPPREGDDSPLQFSCLENPMDGGAWQATVLRVPKSRTQLKRLSAAQPFCTLTTQGGIFPSLQRNALFGA